MYKISLFVCILFFAFCHSAVIKLNNNNIGHAHTKSNGTASFSLTASSTSSSSPTSSPTPSVSSSVSSSATVTATRFVYSITASSTATQMPSVSSSSSLSRSKSVTPFGATNSPSNSRYLPSVSAYMSASSWSGTNSPSRSKSPLPGGPCTAYPILGLSSKYNTTVYGSTENEPGFFYPNCDTTGSSGTTWYEIIATSNGNLTASTCGNYTNFDTIISIYSGTCNDLHCVTYNDDFCSTQSSTTWETQKGKTYFIGVSGYGTEEGKFVLTISENNGNDVGCANAIPVYGPYSNSVIIDGNNRNGYQSNPSNGCDVKIENSLVWYQVFPTLYSYVYVSTCSAVTNFDTLVSVFYGTCSDLSCFAYNYDYCHLPTQSHGSFVYFYPVEDVNYYIAVQGINGAVGNYQLNITQT